MNLSEYRANFDKEKWYATVKRDDNGMPIFIGGADTYWGLALGWRGDVVIEGKTYDVHFGHRTWGCIGIYKRNLPDTVHIKLIELFDTFKLATNEEKRLKKSINKETMAIYQKTEVYKEKQEKSTKLMLSQHALQINEIFKMIVAGKSRFEITNTLKEKYDYSDRRVNQLLVETNRKIQKHTDDERSMLKAKHTAMLQQLFEDNLKEGDRKECRIVLETLNRMYGVHEIEKDKQSEELHIKFTIDIPNQNSQPNVINIPHEEIPKEFKKIEQKINTVPFEDIEVDDKMNIKDFIDEDEEDEDE